MKKNAENADNFICKICDFIGHKKSDWIRHISTRKHANSLHLVTLGDALVTLGMKKTPISKYACQKCEKEYQSRNGLWVHKKTCNNVYIPIETTNHPIASKAPSQFELGNINKDNLIEYLIKENSEFKGLIMELIKKDNSTNITNNTTNNTNCHNSFNLNLFLNEKCKDAINISDFVDNVKMQLSDLENFGHLGYVEGISRILIKNLNDLDTLKRPIHCSDLKREVLYIKDNNEWTKETEEKLVIKNAIKQVANKNIKQIQTWKQENPDCIHSESRKNDQYMNIVMNSMSGGTSEEQCNNISQIIKNVSKEVIINK